MSIPEIQVQNMTWVPKSAYDKLQADNLLVADMAKKFADERDELKAYNTNLLWANKSIKEYNEKLAEALKYYAHKDHYEDRMTLSGHRPPGVMAERGDKAREALADYSLQSADKVGK
jgi:hypothetical protein